MFNTPTVAGIAALLQNSSKDDSLPLRILPRNTPLALSRGQYRLWFIEQMVQGRSDFNMAYTAELSPKILDTDVQRAMDILSGATEGLRVLIQAFDGVPMQLPCASTRPCWSRIRWIRQKNSMHG